MPHRSFCSQLRPLSEHASCSNKTQFSVAPLSGEMEIHTIKSADFYLNFLKKMVP